MVPFSGAARANVQPVNSGFRFGHVRTTAQIANAAGVAAIGAGIFCNRSRVFRATGIGCALFALSIPGSAAFLSWMRRAPA